MSDLGECICYLVNMVFVVATFPISVPYLAFIDAINDTPYPFYTPPWTQRKLEKECEVRLQKKKEEAYKKTYAYRNSQLLYA